MRVLCKMYDCDDDTIIIEADKVVTTDDILSYVSDYDDDDDDLPVLPGVVCYVDDDIRVVPNAIITNDCIIKSCQNGFMDLIDYMTFEASNLSILLRDLEDADVIRAGIGRVSSFD